MVNHGFQLALLAILSWQLYRRWTKYDKILLQFLSPFGLPGKPTQQRGPFSAPAKSVSSSACATTSSAEHALRASALAECARCARGREEEPRRMEREMPLQCLDVSLGSGTSPKTKKEKENSFGCSFGVCVKKRKKGYPQKKRHAHVGLACWVWPRVGFGPVLVLGLFGFPLRCKIYGLEKRVKTERN